MIEPSAYYTRQIQLWGEETQNALQHKRIAIIGCGGLGCSLALALGASGIGTIHLVDFDTVSLHNIHRQVILTLQTEGDYKADVVASMVKARSPFVDIVTHKVRFEDFAEAMPELDLIIDATDNLPTRLAINNAAKSRGLVWLYGSVEAWNGQVALFDRADFSLFQITDRKPAGIAAPIVMHIASLQANLALRYLAKLPVVKDKLYYLFFNPDGELVTQKFHLPTHEGSS